MSDPSRRPNVLVILTDQQRFPTPYEPEELRRWRHDEFAAEREASARPASASPSTTRWRLRVPRAGRRCSRGNIRPCTASPRPMGWGRPSIATTCSGCPRIPFRRWVIGFAPAAIGHSSRASGTPRTWRCRIPAARAICCRSTMRAIRNEENIAAYLEANLLDQFGFSEWVGPEPHGLGKHNTGSVKDVFTADETIALLQRIDGDEERAAMADGVLVFESARQLMFGVVGLLQGMRYHPSTVPDIPKPPTHDEDLSTKPACQQSYVDEWKTIASSAAVDRDASQVPLSGASTPLMTRSPGCSTRCAQAETTRTQSSCSAPTTATCSAPTAGCTRNGTTPTRNRSTSRSSWRVR